MFFGDRNLSSWGFRSPLIALLPSFHSRSVPKIFHVCMSLLLHCFIDTIATLAFQGSNGKYNRGLGRNVEPGDIVLFLHGIIRCRRTPHRCAESPQSEEHFELSRDSGETEWRGARSCGKRSLDTAMCDKERNAIEPDLCYDCQPLAGKS
jgi:hypothetical protein